MLSKRHYAKLMWRGSDEIYQCRSDFGCSRPPEYYELRC